MSETEQDDFGSKIVPRADWEVGTAAYVPKLPLPAKLVVLGYPANSYTRSKVGSLGFIDRLRTIQYVDMKKYPDIKYSFIIGDDARVYECRGWTRVPSLPLKYKFLSFKSIYIALIGDFEREPPKENLLELRDELIDYGVKQGYISRRHAVMTLRNSIGSPLDDYDYTRETASTGYYRRAA